MAKNKWRSFQDAVAQVHGETKGGVNPLAMTIKITGEAIPCPAPAWDPDGTYRVALQGTKPRIERLDGENHWVSAPLQAPTGLNSAKQIARFDEVVTRSTNILVMDVSGWSKLGADEIHAYVTRALPRLEKELVGHDFRNTWGDAIVATFPSAKDAAESALKMRDFFERALPRDGIPKGLSCRIALHQGEVIVCTNPLLGREDVFGDAVHLAARLEPVTCPGQVFCTDTFARALGAITNLAPRASPVGKRKLAKDYGEIDAFVVTWHNEQPSLEAAVEPKSLFVERDFLLLDGEDAEAQLLGWVNQLSVAQSGHSFLLHQLDADLHLVPGAASRLIEGVIASRGHGTWKIERKTHQVVVLRCSVGAIVVSQPSRGW